MVDEDEAVNESNYEIDTDGNADISGAKFDLSADGTSVTVTFAAGMEAMQQEKITLTIDGMMDADSVEMAKTAIDVEFIDTTLPVALSAKVVGNDTIKVTFSEPVAIFDVNGDDFEVDGGDYVIQSVTASNNNTELNVQMYSDLEAGAVKIEALNTLKDFAGFSVLNKTFPLTVVVDAAAPTIVGYKEASATAVTLIFDEDIEITDADVANFYHTNTNNTVDGTGSMVSPTDYVLDGNELTLKFTDNELPNGTAYVYVAEGAVNDLWDNENDKLVYEVEVTNDDIAPMVDSIDVETEEQITVNFSEDIADASYDKYSFKVLDKDGVEAKNMIQSIDESGSDKVVINFKEALSGDYTLVTEEVEDVAGNEIAKSADKFNVEDLTAPLHSDFGVTVYNAGAEDQMIKIDFKEAMAITGSNSVLDLGKYVFTNGSDIYDLSDLDAAASIKAVDDNEAVEIKIPSTVDDDVDGFDIDVTDAGPDFIADNISVSIARVADAAGNYTLLTASAPKAIALPSTVDYTVEATDVDTVVVTFDGKLTTFDKDEFKLYEDTDASNDGLTSGTEVVYSKLNTSTNSDGDSVVTFTLATANELSYDALSNDYDLYVVAAGVTNSENIYGEKVTVSDIKVEDAITPAIAVFDDINGNEVDNVVATIVGSDADTITITFEEDLDFTTINKLSFQVEGGDYAVISAVASGTKAVVLTLDSTDVAGVTVADMVGASIVQKATFNDANGNAVSDLSASVAQTDVTAPAAPTATLDTNTIVLAGEAGSTIQYTVNASATIQATVVASGTDYTTALVDTDVVDGDHISVAVTDAAGNTSYQDFVVTEVVAGTITAVD